MKMKFKNKDGQEYKVLDELVMPSDEVLIDAMSEVMAEVGQPCDDHFLLKLGRDFLKAVS